MNKPSDKVYPGLQLTVSMKEEIVIKDGLYKIEDFLFYKIPEIVGVTYTNLVSDKRDAEYVHARRIFCYLTFCFSNYSLTKIGRMLHRDHATVLHSINTFIELCETDKNTNIERLKWIEILGKNNYEIFQNRYDKYLPNPIYK